MKHLAIFILIIFLSANIASIANAQEPDSTTSASPTPAKTTPVEKKAQDLLDRVATKVAELVDKNKRTYNGQVKSVGTTSYTITTSDGDKTVTTSDATDFYRIKASRKSDTDFDGIVKGDDIVAVGTIDPTNGSMTASQIIAKIKRKVVAGKITNLTGTTATVGSDKVDLADASYQQIGTDGEISDAKIGDFKQGSAVLLLAHTPEDGVYSSLKALVINP